MTLPENGHLLRIYVSEADHHAGMPLHEWIVRAAREHGLAGATALRGLSGFGASSRVHTAHILRLSENLPVVVEIVDTIDRIEEFLPLLEDVVSEGLVTVEKVFIRFYRGRSS